MEELKNIFNSEEELTGEYSDEIIKEEISVVQEEYDPFDVKNKEIEVEGPVNSDEQSETELTEWQKIYQEMDITLDDRKEYEAVIIDVKNSNRTLNIILDAYVKGLTKRVRNSYFFSSYDCTVYSISLIKDLANVLGVEVSKDDFANLDTIASLCEKFIEKKVIIVPKTRLDEKTGKSFQNYDVIKKSEGNCELGGNE